MSRLRMFKKQVRRDVLLLVDEQLGKVSSVLRISERENAKHGGRSPKLEVVGFAFKFDLNNNTTQHHRKSSSWLIFVAHKA